MLPRIARPKTTREANKGAKKHIPLEDGWIVYVHLREADVDIP